MKRFLFALSAFAILSFAAGCTREVGDVSWEGDFVKATFNVSLEDDMDTKAISDGSKVNFLIFWAFDKDGLPLQDLEQFAEVRDKKATITVKLIRGVEYNFAFWAQHRVERTEETYWVCYGPKVDAQGNYMKDDQGEYIIDDTVPYMAALMGYEQMEEEMMNNDLYDAFYAKCHVDPLDADLSQDVTLTRPLAQINLAVDSEDLEAAASNNLDMDALTSAFDITGQKDHVFKVLDGTTITNPEYPATLSYYFQPVPGDDIISGNKTYKRLGMIYVLANEDPENLDITFRLRTVQNGSVDVEIKREIKNVPVRRNYRTNIVGKLFSVGGTFNVTVDPGFAPTDNTVNIDAPAPATYWVDPITPEHGTLEIYGPEPWEFEEGNAVKVVATPENGYELTDLYYTDENDGNKTDIDLKTLAFPMPAFNVLVYATFTLIPPTTYTVALSPATNGTLAFAPGTVGNAFTEGTTISLELTPDANYEVDEVSYLAEGSQTPVVISPTPTTSYYQFEMPAANVTVTATFKAVTPAYTYTGDGSFTNPYTIADIRYYIDNDLASDPDAEVFVKGTVSNILYQFSTQFSTATFDMVDAGGTDTFRVYQAYLFGIGNVWHTGHPTVAENDVVVVVGKVTLYTQNNQSIYETVAKQSVISSINGLMSLTSDPTISAKDVTGAPQTVIPADAPLTVTITADDGATIYYTTDGTDPTANSTEYTAPFQITNACTVKAIAVKAGNFNSFIVSQEFTKDGGAGGSITYNFGEHTDFSTWPASYTGHTLSYTEADVIFASADKNSQTITDIPVTKGGDVSMVMKKADAKLAEVTFTCRQWGNKTQTITLHYSTDGGSSYTSTGITSSNFTISDNTLPTGTNAVKITFSSTSNQVGIESVTFKLAD